jgi:cytochrome c556
MRLSIALVPILSLALSACGNPDTPAGRAADQRHKNFEAIGDAMKIIGDQLKAEKPDLEKIRTASGVINGFAPKVPSWFPAGSGPDDGIKTDALQAIWQKPDEFKQAAANFASAASAFDDAAITEDPAAMGEAMKGLGGACKGCHDKFREAD